MKRIKILLILFSFVLILSVLSFIINLKSQNQIQQENTSRIPTPIHSEITNSSGLIPHETNDLQIKQILGNPTSTMKDNHYLLYLYSIPGTSRQNKVYLKNNTLQFYTNEVLEDNSLYQDYTSKNKEDGILYDPNDSEAGFKWHIFAKDGIAFLASDVSGYTIRVIHFPPTDYQSFKTTIGKELKLSESFEEQPEYFNDQ